MIEEKISFKNRKGQKIAGVMVKPGEKEKYPLVILCHGFSSQKNNQTNTTLAPLLAEQGIGSLRFDFNGHGESEGKFEDITLSGAADDINAALEYLKKIEWADKHKIGLFGSSFGGGAAVLAASKTIGLKALILKCPAVDYSNQKIREIGIDGLAEWKRKGWTYYIKSTGKDAGKKFKIKYSLFEDRQKQDLFKEAKKIRIPTLIIHGTADTVVLFSDSEALVESLHRVWLKPIEGANHWFSEPAHFNKMVELAMNWLPKQLMK